MQDRRQEVRDKVLLGGVAGINERGQALDCVVRDISEHGACVEINETTRLPRGISLHIPRKGRWFIAELIWRHADRVGLAFRAMVTDPPTDDLDVRLRRSQIKQRELQKRIKELIGGG
ncbi:PilZ domain-containing protein [Herbaspirillum sp. HC18]|nr:PilZ domain-containing protein [Herbaspirillum sp. HC18]HXI07406.1 PilZ domain-containing protein [Bradyrhizobium sp.]